MILTRAMATIGSAVIGAALLVGAPASAAPTGAAPFPCRVDSWVFRSIVQTVTYDNCANYAVNKRGIIGDESGPCLSIPALKQYNILHQRNMPGPYSPWNVSVVDC